MARSSLLELQLLEITVPDQPNVWSSRRATTMTAGLEIDHAFVWFNGQPVGEYGPNRTADAGVLASGHTARPLAAEDIFYTFTDHLGTPLLQLTRTGQVAWRAEYEPYGNVYTMRTGARSDQPLRLPGQDVAMTWEGAEENYNVFRWYRAGWGRYTQADPIGVRAVGHLYAYALDNPTRNVDLRGLKCCVKSFTKVLTPIITKTEVAVKSTVCAEVCGNSADCFLSQHVVSKGFAGKAWGETAVKGTSTVDEDQNSGAYKVFQPSPHKVCLADPGIGDSGMPPESFPVASTSNVTVTVSDKTGECTAASTHWKATVSCSSPGNCYVYWTPH